MSVLKKMKSRKVAVAFVFLLVMLCGCGKIESKVDVTSRKVDVELQSDIRN